MKKIKRERKLSLIFKSKKRRKVMKKMLWLLLSSFIFSDVHAGLPSQDPAVAVIQALFKNARKPEESDLKLGQNWYCWSFDATTRSTSAGPSKGNPLFNFTQIINGIVLNPNKGVDVFIPITTSFVGSFVAKLSPHFDYSSTFFIYLRTGLKGELLFEMTTQKWKRDPRMLAEWFAESSVSNPKEHEANLYGTCSTVAPQN